MPYRENVPGTVRWLLLLFTLSSLCSAATLTVSPLNPRQLSHSTLQFTAMLNKKDVSKEVQWGSSNPGVATIASGGLATLLGQGTTTITAAHNKVDATTTVLTVTVAASPTFSAQPPDTNVGAVIKGNSGGVKVQMLDNLGDPLSGQSVTIISIGSA